MLKLDTQIPQNEEPFKRKTHNKTACGFSTFTFIYWRLMVQQFQTLGKRDLWKTRTIGLTKSRIKRGRKWVRLDEKQKPTNHK
jgi:hypothetical protein